MANQIVDPERLEELRAALARLDPEGRKAWQLEIYDQQNGIDKLRAVVDIKTGRKLGQGRPRQPASVSVETGKGGQR